MDDNVSAAYIHHTHKIAIYNRNALWPWASYLHLSASVTKQYNLVPAKGVISLAEKVTAGLAESNGSLLELRDSAESKFDSIRFTIVASLGDKAIYELWSALLNVLAKLLTVILGTSCKCTET